MTIRILGGQVVGENRDGRRGSSGAGDYGLIVLVEWWHGLVTIISQSGSDSGVHKREAEANGTRIDPSGDGCAAPPVLGLLLFPFTRPLRAGLTHAAPPALTTKATGLAKAGLYRRKDFLVDDASAGRFLR